jgi:hypothetical protein
MEQEKIKLKQRAEELAEKYEDAKDKQEELMGRQDTDSRNNFLVVNAYAYAYAMCLDFLELFTTSE